MNSLVVEIPSIERQKLDLSVDICDIFGDPAAFSTHSSTSPQYCQVFNHRYELVGYLDHPVNRGIYDSSHNYLGRMSSSGQVYDGAGVRIGYVLDCGQDTAIRDDWCVDVYRYLGKGDSAYKIARIRYPDPDQILKSNSIDFARATGGAVVLLYVKLPL